MLKASAAVLCLCLTAAPALAEKVWTQIQPGYTWDYADAVCKNAAMGTAQGYWAYGNTGHLLGAAIGNAIGNAIRQDQYYKNCMVMGGWKQVNVQRPKASGNKVTVKAVGKASGKRKMKFPAQCRNAQSDWEIKNYC